MILRANIYKPRRQAHWVGSKPIRN